MSGLPGAFGLKSADQRTSRTFTVGIVINKATEYANSMAENYFTGFLATGESPYLNNDPSLDVN